MSITGIAGVADASALEAANAVTQGGAELDRNSFLNLLTTQMQYQDPLDPMKNEEMVAQLATFSSLEQLMDISSATETNTATVANLTNITMASLVGTEVLAVGDTLPYDGEGGDLDLHFVSSGKATATVNVYDETGKLVHSAEIAVEEGDGSYTWDGEDLSGQTAEEGDYTFEVKTNDGSDVTIDERIKGMVDSMDYSTGTPLPTVDGVPVSLSDLIRLTVPDGEGA
ncbi:MAG: flagellar hook assembly protein FlgD [Myxococcota bacterium]|nr:flagellar hook assembly protein FlgD [Myxococcota bacterium]